MESSTAKLYYFTGTGNSLKIAKDIGMQIGKHELIPITKLMNQNKDIIIDGDIVGFVFPVYFARPPVFIKEFIEKAEFKDTSYIFAVQNGGGMFGKSLKIFEEYINEKSKNLDAGFIIGMPGNHPKIAAMQKTTPEEHYAQETIKVKKIVKHIKAKIPNTIETNYGLMGNILSYLAFRKPYNDSIKHELDKIFYVNENCINCGTCERVCPVDNITDSNVKPIWNNRCINCLACYHHCEQKAIIMTGEEKFVERYTHPEIGLEEIMGS